jgi:PAS domain S-box-containing protein
MQPEVNRPAHSLSFCCTLSSAGMILAINPSRTIDLGYAVESLLQTSVFLLFHADDRAKLQSAFITFVQHLATASVPARLLKSDGNRVSVTVTVQVLQGLETVFLLSCDPEESLRPSEERWHRFVEISQEGIWEIDAEGNTNFVNSRMAAMLGYTMKDMLGMSLFAFMDEEWRAIAVNNITRRQQGVTEQHDFKFCRKDGSEVWVIISTSPIFDETGQYIGALATVIDITEHKLAEAALRASEAKLNNVLDNAVAAVYSFRVFANSDWEYDYFSSGAQSIYGYSADEFLSDQQLWNSRIPRRDWEPMAPYYFENILAGRTTTSEYRFRCKDNTLCWISETLRSRRDDAQDCWVVTAVSVNITDRKLAEVELRKSEEKFRAIFENAAIGIIVSLPSDRKITQSNLAFQQMLGYSAEELATLDYTHITNAEDLLIEQQLIQKALKEKQNTYTLEKRHLCKDGQIIWVNIVASLIWKKNRQLQMTIVMIENISERKRAEAVLRDNEAHFRKVFADAPIGVALVTSEGQITQANSAFCQMLDYSELELKTQLAYDLIHIEDVEQHLSCTRQLFNQEIPQYKIEGRFLQSNGKIVWVKVTAVLFQESSSGMLYKLVMFENITERRAVEQMKDHFVSVVSHELRTPLTSIRGSLGLLATGQIGILTSEGQEVLDIAILESQRLMRLVSDIMDLERLRSGHISLVKSFCRVSDLIARAVDSVRAIANKSKIEIEASAVSGTVWVDGDRIIQTLINLLDNAIKFSSPNCRVWVTVQFMTEAIEISDKAPFTASPGVLFEVKDQGSGIPPDKIGTIFEPFEQVNTKDFRHKGGTGLGLAICQNIIQGHGGQIWATSILDQGSSFFFTIPVPQ